MSEKRMFSKNIVLSDVFLSLPPSTQALYYLFGMNCDDDGVIPNPIALMKMGKYKKSDYQNLLDKRYILEDEESKVAIIKHHKINNYIPKDRYKPSTYQEELEKLTINEYGAYTEKATKKSSKSRKVSDKSCIQPKVKPVSSSKDFMYTQSSIDKSRLDKSKVVVEEDNNKKTEIKKEMQQLEPVYQALEDNFPMASTTWILAIDKYKGVISDELIINAIQETAIAGINNPKYFKAICERYKMNGFKTVKDIEQQNKIKPNNKVTQKKLDRKEYDNMLIKQMESKNLSKSIKANDTS